MTVSRYLTSMLTKYLEPDVSGLMVTAAVSRLWTRKRNPAMFVVRAQGGCWQLGSPAPVLVISRQMKYDVQ